jgi:hypothetical protein
MYEMKARSFPFGLVPKELLYVKSKSQHVSWNTRLHKACCVHLTVTVIESLVCCVYWTPLKS